MKSKFLFMALFVVVVGLLGAHINTSGRCSITGTCELGDSNTDAIQLTTDGATFGVDVTSNTAILTATTTDIATFTGADAAAPADTVYDTTGAGTVTIGSADVTGVSVITDGGTFSIDGYGVGDKKIVSRAAGTLDVNTITEATATADYLLPDCTGAGAGVWVDVIVRDASETISLKPSNPNNIISYSGITPAAGDELDSPTAGATTAGSAISLVCLGANKWYSVGTVGLWVDGGAPD